MRPKTAGIVLLLALVLPFLAVIAFLQYQKMDVKREVRRQINSGIDKSEILILSFTQKETETLLKWKHSREFEYLGQMYDIVEQEIKGDSLIYYCWHDTKETRIKSKLAALLRQAKGNSPWRSETQKRISNFFNSLFLCENPTACTITHPVKMVENPYTFYINIFAFPPPIPPPQIG